MDFLSINFPPRQKNSVLLIYGTLGILHLLFEKYHTGEVAELAESGGLLNR